MCTPNMRAGEHPSPVVRVAESYNELAYTKGRASGMYSLGNLLKDLKQHSLCAQIGPVVKDAKRHLQDSVHCNKSHWLYLL